MKKNVILLSAFLLTAALYAENLSGLDIIKKCKDISAPKTSSTTATLTIHSNKGGNRIREIIMKSKEFGDVTKEVIVFTTPKDVAGVGYLMFNYSADASGNKKDSDNWLYMPAMKKTRRVASSGTESESSFMGTDFTYEDIGDRGYNKDDYNLIGEENIDGTDCYKVEAVSKNQTEKEPRRIVYIGKDDFIMYKCEFFDRQNTLHRVLTCSEVSTIDGYKSAKTMKMENVQSGTWSLIQLKDLIYNADNIDDSLFTVAALEKERIR